MTRKKRTKSAIARLKKLIEREQLYPAVEKDARRILRDLERATESGDPRAVKNAVARFARFWLQRQ